MSRPLPSRAIGRLITVRGSSVVLGFMPLKRFHLDTALDASAVVALRASRLTGETGLTDSTTVGEWLHRLGVDVVAPIVPLLSPRRPLPVVEVGTGVGPLFERLKGLLPGDALGPYTAVGPADEAIRFAMLHDGDGTAYAYADGFDPAAADDAALVLNHNQAVRHGHGLDLDWLGLAAARRDATVLSLRVSLRGDEERLSVNGHAVPLAGVERARDVLRRADTGWRVRLLSGFDDGFFLPPAGLVVDPDAPRQPATSGLLVGVLSRAEAGLAGFRAV